MDDEVLEHARIGGAGPPNQLPSQPNNDPCHRSSNAPLVRHHASTFGIGAWGLTASSTSTVPFWRCTTKTG